MCHEEVRIKIKRERKLQRKSQMSTLVLQEDNLLAACSFCKMVN